MTRRRPPRSTAPRRAGRRAPSRLWLAAILAVTFVVYIPSLQNGFTNWDDDAYVTDNRLLAHPAIGALLTTPVRGNFHPLTIASLALNYRLSGLHPASYHWLSLLIHLANTALVFVFVRQLARGRFWTTIATALFFGIHPMHVESVAWIAERKDVLYAFFYLIGLIAYLRYLDTRRRRWLVAAFLAYVLSAASKPAAIVFPLTLLLLDWYRERPFRAGALLEKAPFVIVSAATGYLTLLAQESIGALNVQASPFRKLLFVAYGFLMYLVKLFVPVHLSAIHPYPKVPGPDYYVAFVVALGLIPVLVYLCRRSRAVCFGLAFFLINIVLVIQIANVGEAVMAERYTYLPYIGLLFALAWWLDERGERPGSRLARPILIACFLAMLPLGLVQTWARCRVWKSSETLWTDAIRKYPDQNFDAYYHRGSYRLQVTHQVRAALADMNQTVALNPRLARGWLGKGVAHTDLGELDSASVCYDRALSLNPRLEEAWSNRGVVELNRGRLDQAARDFSRALQLDSTAWDAYANRALVDLAAGKRLDAIADLQRALAWNPGNSALRNALGTTLQQLGRNQEAVEEFDAALRAAPMNDPQRGSYLLNRSRSWSALGDRARAVADAEEARRLGVQVPRPSP